MAGHLAEVNTREMKHRGETPGTYHKMDTEETIWEEDRRHRTHHHHRHRRGRSREQQGSTDNSVEMRGGAGGGMEEEYKDSLYSPAPVDSLNSREYSPRPGGGGGARDDGPGRFSPRPRRQSSTTWESQNNEMNCGDIYDQMGKRGKEGRVVQDQVPRGGAAETGQLRGGVGGGGGGAGVRSGKMKVGSPPPVAQKPDKKIFNKLGMEELWPGSWEEFSKHHFLLQ